MCVLWKASHDMLRINDQITWELFATTHTHAWTNETKHEQTRQFEVNAQKDIQTDRERERDK